MTEQQDQQWQPGGRTSWKAAEITGVVCALLGGVFAALSAFDAVTATFLWFAVVLAVIGMVLSGAAIFLAPRSTTTFVVYTGWGLILGAGVLFWVVSALIDLAGL